MPNEDGIQLAILEDLLTKRRMSGAELARRIGVNKSSISLILSGKHHSTSVATAAKMAQVFGVSLDYLVGLSDSPEPSPLQLGELLFELILTAKQLSSSRQRDLLLIARAFLEESQAPTPAADRSDDVGSQELA